MQTQKLIVSPPDILGGTPVFVGTRVPVRNLTDYLEAGDTLDVFLDDFPSVDLAYIVPQMLSAMFDQEGGSY